MTATPQIKLLITKVSSTPGPYSHNLGYFFVQVWTILCIQFTFTFMHLADAFIQSDLQLHSGYTFSLVCINQTNLISLIYEEQTPLYRITCLHMNVINNPAASKHTLYNLKQFEPLKLSLSMTANKIELS